MLQNSSKAQEKLKNHLCKIRLLFQNSTRTSKVSDRTLFIHSTRTLCIITIQKSKRTIHYSWTVIVTVHQTMPWQNHSVYCLLSVEKKFTQSCTHQWVHPQWPLVWRRLLPILWRPICSCRMLKGLLQQWTPWCHQWIMEKLPFHRKHWQDFSLYH